MKFPANPGRKGHFLELCARYGHTAISGVLLVVIQPPVSLYYFAFFSLIPLMATIEKNNLSLSFKRGFVTGMIAYIGLIYWVVVAMNRYGGINIPISIFILLLFALYLSLYMGMFAFACAFLEKKISVPIYLSAPAVWVILEYLRGTVMTGFPWVFLAHSQYGFLPFIQIASVTGTYFISFLIVAVNSILYAFWARKRPSLLWVSIICLLIVFSLTYGLVRLGQKEGGQTHNVAIVQGNIRQDVKWDETFKTMTIGKYSRLSLEQAQKADIVIWPETAIPFIFDLDAETQKYVKAIPPMLESLLLFGTVGLDRKGNLLNIVHYIDQTGKTVDTYTKVHLVPFGEYTPLVSYLPFLERITAAGASFVSGKEGHRPVQTDAGNVGILICFEGVFPYITNETVRNGAQVLANLTNDAWYDRTSAAYQHFASYVFRAIETDRFVMRAANTGISGIIDSRGRIHRKTMIFTEEVLRGTYTLKNTMTFYVRHGDYFIVLCFVFLAFITAAGAVRTRQTG